MSSTPSVLCAVDLSDHSRKVMQHAGAIADHFRARLIAATVISPRPIGGYLAASGDAPDLESVVRSFVRDVLPGVESWTPPYRITVASGSPPSAILRLARDESADLIVVGTHGVGGFRKHLFGSTTAGVLRHAEVPVLVVPAAAADLRSLDDWADLRHVDSVLTAVDFSELSRRDARIAAGIARTLGVPLLLTHVVAQPRIAGLADELSSAHTAHAELDALRAELSRDTPIETLLLQGHPADEIAGVVEERHVGLVVMGLRGAGGLLGPRPGSIAYRVICLSPALLLAIPPTLVTPAPRSVAARRPPVWRRTDVMAP
jgi:nucleotide-binding universal stress UspA family protein